MAKVRWISLSKADTGFVFATTHSVQSPVWDWISRVASEEFGHPEEDFYCVEDDDGREFVKYFDTKLIEIHDGRLVGNAAGATPLQPSLRSVAEKIYAQSAEDYANWRWTDEADHHNVVVL